MHLYIHTYIHVRTQTDKDSLVQPMVHAQRQRPRQVTNQMVHLRGEARAALQLSDVGQAPGLGVAEELALDGGHGLCVYFCFVLFCFLKCL